VRLPVLLGPLKAAAVPPSEPTPEPEAPALSEDPEPPAALGDNVIAFAPR
jgi:cell cycle sensor histidine kinase DivJ